MRTLPRQLVLPAFVCILGACAQDANELPTAPPLLEALYDDEENDGPPRFSDWGAPVNVGPPVNTALVEQQPAISDDGLTLYFNCAECPGGLGGADIWVAHRATVNDPWGVPQNLGPNINTAYNDAGASLSVDGHKMYFTSDRPEGFGGTDIYFARRRDKHDDLGWRPAVNLGSVVNSTDNEGAPQPFVDPETGSVVLYFSSSRPGLGSSDIYASTKQPDGTFGPPQLITELSSEANDQAPSPRRDGLEFYLASNRSPSAGLDIWVSTRARRSDPWPDPVNLGPAINGPGSDAGVDLSLDGTALYFHSANRPGNVGGPFFDIWFITRDKLRAGDDDKEPDDN